VPAERRARAAVLLELCKPRLVSLVLFTTGIGYVMGYPGRLGPAALLGLLHTVLGTALVAGGSMAFNQVVERITDGLMRRTRNRPLPTGRLSAQEAWAFGGALSALGAVYLLLCVNALAAGLALLTSLVYVAAYTPLKRLTTLNTIVGAVAGAIPPMVGYAGAAGTLSEQAWALFGILFVWQIPHFLGIAWMCRDDYARAGLRMLPVIDAEGRFTARQILLFSVALVAVSLIPRPLGMAGTAYAVTALILGAAFVGFAGWLNVTRCVRSARQVFLASVIYLPILLAALMADRT
jgi:protoheme IX farnesyltransferase